MKKLITIVMCVCVMLLLTVSIYGISAEKPCYSDSNGHTEKVAYNEDKYDAVDGSTAQLKNQMSEMDTTDTCEELSELANLVGE